MKNFSLGIIREEKSPPDKRVPFTPTQCVELMQEFPGLKIIVQPSPVRCYTDKEYSSLGITLQEDLSACDLIMGVKEIPIDKLIADKTYFIFSHVIKKQPHNQKLMKAFVNKKNTVIDYETLTDQNHNRIIGFGRYAGIVGAYNGLRGYAIRYGLVHLKPANQCHDKTELETELKRLKLPNIKILITGGGRVANGATETMSMLKIRKVTPYEFLNHSYREPVYCQLHSKDYFETDDGSLWNMNDFYTHPEKYRSKFWPYTKTTDLLISGHYWDPRCARLFSKEEINQPDFRTSVIADISCDINGSVPSTLRASSIEEPFYGYDPATQKEGEPFSNNTITIMAVDNLPCELPRDSSEGFGKELMERVMPSLLGKDENGIIERATILKNGKLTKAFEYLSEYAY